MSIDSENLQEASLIIASELCLDENETDFFMKQNSYEVLKNNVAEKIIYLLNNEPEKLKYILYRIDISEQKVLEALASLPQQEASLQITELILKREIQKAITRKQYSYQVVDPDLAL